MRGTTLRSSFLALLLVLVPVASVAARSESITLPANALISISAAEAQCVGEQLTIHGTVHVVLRDGQPVQASLRGVYGVGATTGRHYRIVGTLHGNVDNLSLPGTVLTFNIVGGGRGHTVLEHVVITPNGVVHDARAFVCQ